MDAITRQGKQLQYVAIYPDEYDPKKKYPLLFLLHGFGANMEDLAELAPAISATGYVYICPNAPLEFEMGPYQMGYGWMPRGDGSIPQDAEAAEQVLGSFINDIFAADKSLTRGNAVLLGFSQGGSMAYRCGLPQPDTFAGIACICSVVPETRELEARLPAKRTQQVFVAYGEQDTMVEPARAHLAQTFLKKAGYPLFFKGYPMGHEISPAVIADLRRWLAKVLPAAH
ncbi:MAG: hypothetical protein EXR67_03985 [Dehalococcoidia bacterium]|nr:hypothetical protein [Dehalococcoidia bacterium]